MWKQWLLRAGRGLILATRRRVALFCHRLVGMKGQHTHLFSPDLLEESTGILHTALPHVGNPTQLIDIVPTRCWFFLFSLRQLPQFQWRPRARTQLADNRSSPPALASTNTPSLAINVYSPQASSWFSTSSRPWVRRETFKHLVEAFHLSLYISNDFSSATDPRQRGGERVRRMRSGVIVCRQDTRTADFPFAPRYRSRAQWRHNCVTAGAVGGPRMRVHWQLQCAAADGR